MTYPILYSFCRCPYAMRARLGLFYAEIICELREVDLKNKPFQMLEISPKGTVPVLLLPNGKVLEESLVILDWALMQQDKDGWRVLTPHQIALENDLIHSNDNIFKNHLNRYKYPTRFKEEWENLTESEFSLKNREEALVLLRKLENLLSECSYLIKDTPSKADVAIFPFIRQFSMVEPEWFETLPFPCLQKWLQTFLKSDLFQRVMVSYDPWKPEDTPILMKL